MATKVVKKKPAKKKPVRRVYVYRNRRSSMRRREEYVIFTGTSPDHLAAKVNAAIEEARAFREDMKAAKEPDRVYVKIHPLVVTFDGSNYLQAAQRETWSK
jgi:hypothetical protein